MARSVFPSYAIHPFFLTLYIFLPSAALPRETQTALQVYCNMYKQAPVAQSHALLRKARRLDHVLEEKDLVALNGHGANAALPAAGDENGADPQCAHCQTAFSPFFHPLPRAGTFACHRCHFEGRTQMPLTNGHIRAHGLGLGP